MENSLIRICGLSMLLMLAGCATMTDSELELTAEGKLPPCPATPNCVSSDAVERFHRIEPLALGTDPKLTWKALLTYLKTDSSYRIKVQTADYVRAEARTQLLRFVDDVEFHLRPGLGQIAMRSASRVGISDLGKNRQRLEAVRQTLNDAGHLGNGG